MKNCRIQIHAILLTALAGLLSLSAEETAAPLAEPLRALQGPETNIHGTPVVKMWEAPPADPDQPALGYPSLPDVQHTRIHAATAESGGYSHHAQIIVHEGRFHVIWSCNRNAEDAPGQRILYSTSGDGVSWSPAIEAFPAPDREGGWDESGLHVSARGLVSVGSRLFAMAGLYETAGWENAEKTEFREKRSPSEKIVFAKRRHHGVLAREILKDGTWGPVFTLGNKLPQTDRLLFSVRLSEECLSSEELDELRDAFQKNPHPNGMPTTPDPVRLVERTGYTLPSGLQVGLFRDDRYSHRVYVTTSWDGVQWSDAFPSNIPDAPSFTKAIALPDHRIVLVGNQVASPDQLDVPRPAFLDRNPLTLSISEDGLRFTRVYSLKSGSEPFTVPGVGGRGREKSGGQYPSLCLHEDALYVVYSAGKEDIWISRVPLTDLEPLP